MYKRQLFGLLKFKLASVSGKVLEACPDDYRQAFQACMEAGRDFVRQFEGVEMEEPQFHREYSRYQGKCRAIMQPVKSKYRLEEALADPIIFLRREIDPFRKDKAKLLERFKVLKRQVEQETFTFPEITEQEREKFGMRMILY